jgi:hypothetical protein
MLQPFLRLFRCLRKDLPPLLLPTDNFFPTVECLTPSVLTLSSVSELSLLLLISRRRRQVVVDFRLAAQYHAPEAPGLRPELASGSPVNSRSISLGVASHECAG